MCEIAVIDPEQFPIQSAQQLAGTFHEEQGDGLGVVAVLNEGDEFRYEIYKSTDPHWQTLYVFLNRLYDRAWRFVIHGRNKTSGEVNRETAHPIAVDCDQCEFDYVVHNGSVTNYSRKQESLREGGHSLNTGVDTEVIAHTVSGLPETVEEHDNSTYSLYGNLNYLLFSENGILVRSDERYHLTDDFTMTCSTERFEDPEFLGFDTTARNGWALISPDESSPDVETKQRSVASRNRSNYYNNGSSSAYRTPAENSGVATAEQTSLADLTNGGWPVGDEHYAVEYRDLSPFDHVVIIKVAPGVLRMIDTERDDDTFVDRDVEPRLYYHFAPDTTPENIDLYEQHACGIPADPDAEIIDDDDINEEIVVNAVAEEVQTTVAEEIDELTVREVADIQDDILAATGRGIEAAQEVDDVAA